jgi:hypothetical protein
MVFLKDLFEKRKKSDQGIVKEPPRCIAEYEIDESSALLERVESRDGLVHYALRCTCGEKNVNVLGHTAVNEAYPGRQIFIGPLALECLGCGSIMELMDPRKDGYDAEFGYCYSMVGDGSRDKFKCSKCRREPMEVVAGFEYSLDKDEIESDEEMSEHPQDFFMWFTLCGQCESCGAFQEISQYECA